jgi:hypothetical protein
MFAITSQGVAGAASSKQHLPLSNLEYDGIDYDIMLEIGNFCVLSSFNRWQLQYTQMGTICIENHHY